jgi:hemoglobin
MSGIRSILLAALIAAPVTVGAAFAQESLYQRLGGYDAIAAAVDGIIQRVEHKFDGFSTDSRMRVRQNIVDFICKATGGPCVYSGRDIKTAHAGIGITKAEWDAFVVAFGETMKELNVPEAEQNELAAMMLPLEKDIVEKP